MKFVGIGSQHTTAVVLAAAAFFGVQNAAMAQTAAINGSAANFDVANNQGEDAHGFEVEFEGVQPEDVASTFDTQRYGPPRIDATSTVIVVRWTSAYDGTAFVASTTPHDPAAPLAGSCYQWACDSYASSGCEHLGVPLPRMAWRPPLRGLTADPARPGSLVPGSTPIIVAAPAYSVAAPAVNGGAPVLNADVDAPPAPRFSTRY